MNAGYGSCVHDSECKKMAQKYCAYCDRGKKDAKVCTAKISLNVYDTINNSQEGLQDPERGSPQIRELDRVQIVFVFSVEEIVTLKFAFSATHCSKSSIQSTLP